MKDSIEENLAFKLTAYLGLLGAWLYLVNHYLSFIPLGPKSFIPWCVIVLSYVLFYPIVQLTMMLVYTSLYQVQVEKEKIEEIKSKYERHAKEFFNWWSIAILLAPAFIIISFFPDKYWYLIIIFSILCVFIIWFVCFKNIFALKDSIKYFQFFWKRLLIYTCFFAALVFALYNSR